MAINPGAMWDGQYGGRIYDPLVAKAFFERHQPGDPHRLDGDGDGRACEGHR